MTSGARIAEYSQLYDQVMFKDPPGSTGQTPAPQHHAHPGLPSSSSMPETSLEEDWLLSTYSNGDLASFVSPSCKAQTSSGSQHRLAHACSVPSLKTTPPCPAAPAPQRLSSCVSALDEEEEHIYSTIKRHPSSNAPPSESSPSGRCQSAGSLSGPQQEDHHRSGHRCKEPGVGRNHDGLCGPDLGRAGRQSSLPERRPPGQTDLTLQDGEQVVVPTRGSAQSATQNYLAHFKDNEEDDDDYVEIRSEDESEAERNGAGQRNGGPVAPANQNRALVQSRSLPCTPARSYDPLRSSLDHEHLEKYLWSDPPQNPPNIVQSLREKFQCLSSSSFA